MSDTNYIFDEMNTEALEPDYHPDNRYRYIRPTVLAPIIPGSYVIHQFYLTAPEINRVTNIEAVTVQYAFGTEKILVKTADPLHDLVQLEDACEVTVQLTKADTESFIRLWPEINIPKKPYLTAYCQLIIETKTKVDTENKVIKSGIYDIRVELPLNNYERILEEDDT